MRRRTGCIDKVDGRYRVRITTEAGRRFLLGTYDTHEEAVTQRRAALELIIESDPETNPALADWCDKWLTMREINKSVADPDSDRSRFENHIKNDPIGNIGIKSIRKGDLKDWITRTRLKIAAQTTRNTLNIIRGALESALDDEMISTNYARGLSVPQEKRTKEAWAYLTVEEQSRLIDQIPGPEKWIVAFAIGTGLRAGELVSLHLADVHEDHVTVRYGGKNKPTKTGRIREVPLFGLARQALSEWKKSGFVKRNPHKLLFPRVRGEYRSKEHVLKWDVLRAAYARAGITRHIRWHDLRHTCASSLVSGWWGRRWSLEEVCAMLGHSDIKVTQRYAHLADTALKQAARETVFPGYENGSATIAQLLGNIAVPPTGIGPATNGLGNRGTNQGHQGDALKAQLDKGTIAVLKLLLAQLEES